MLFFRIIEKGGYMKSYTILDASMTNFPKIFDYKEVKSAFWIKKHYLVKQNKTYKKGDYFTITFTDKGLISKKECLITEVSKILKSILKKYHKTGKVLIIGLGNPKIIADALGPTTTSKIMATYQYDFLTIPKVALYNPNVTSNTGISSFHLIKMVVKDLEPDLIIVIDSLQTKNISNLDHTIEINDAGIIPGSLLNINKEINYKTFNIPLITIGSPLVYQINNNLFTSVNSHEVLNNISEIISCSLKNILF